MKLTSPGKPVQIILRKILAVRRRIAALSRKLLFPFQAISYGAKLQMASSVRFEHSVRFQGYGQLILEEGVVLGYHLAGAFHNPILLQPREPDAVIQIGKKTIIVNGCEIIARTSIMIGENCLIGPRCVIVDADFHGIRPDERNTPGLTAEVVIGNNVWFGSQVMVLKGVHIGDNAIVGAGCVVTKNIPDGAIAVGNPMKIIGSVYD